MSAAKVTRQKEGLGRFRPYPKYRDSGVEWLGQMPAHWQIRRLKTVASVQLSNVDKKSVEDQESVRLCNYIDVYYKERISNDIDFMAATATPEQVRRFSLRAADVLITKDSESWADIAVSAVVAEDLPGVLCGYHLALIRPSLADLDGSFLARACAAIGPRDQFQIGANGITRFGLTGDAIRTAVFGVPPIREQQAIATFLDRETARIDALSAKKERLIELLQEKRTALITRTVTKGLDPNVPMKDSGVEWLGEIPAHWELKPLKHVLNGGLVNGLFKKKDLYGSGLKLVNVVDLYRNDFVIDFESLERVEANAAEAADYGVIPGDILCVRSSLKLEGVGASAVIIDIPEPTVFECHLVRARPDQTQVLPRLLAIYLNSLPVRQRLVALSETTTMTTISQPKLAIVEVIVPSLSEQHASVEYLDAAMAKIGVSIAKIREGIERLKEYRAALISSAVTGKIDVRGQVA